MRNCVRTSLIVVAAAVLASCELTPSARVDGNMWLMQTSGKVSGADVRRDLGYKGISMQPDVQGSVGVGRSHVTVDWMHLDRTADGQASTGYNFAGIFVPAQADFTSHTKADVISGFYGFTIGPEVFNVTPGIGAAYARYDVRVNGVATNTGLASGALQVPFSAESKNSQPFPIGAIQLESIPLGWLDLIARADGFGLPQGQIAEGQAMARLRFMHGDIQAGYRYIRLNAQSTRLNLQGAMVGAGIYF